MPKISSIDEQSVKLVANALEDCRATCVAEVTSIPPASVFHILKIDLNKRNISARCTIDCLTAE